LAEPDLSIPGHHDVFVIGDLATMKNEQGKPLPGVAPFAMQQGKWRRCPPALLPTSTRRESLPSASRLGPRLF